jgi:poly(3-hydroxybutyrate) depolymerase
VLCRRRGLELEHFALLSEDRLLAVWNAGGASITEIRTFESRAKPRARVLPGLVVLGCRFRATGGASSSTHAALRLGLGVLAPNVRGSAGFYKRFTRAGDVYERHWAIEHVGARVEDVTWRGIADPARIGVMGASYGGHLALASMIRFEALFRAGAVVSAISDCSWLQSHLA